MFKKSVGDDDSYIGHGEDDGDGDGEYIDQVHDNTTSFIRTKDDNFNNNQSTPGQQVKVSTCLPVTIYTTYILLLLLIV